MDAFKESVAQRKGRPRIESLAARKGSAGVGPSRKSKKRSREEGKITMTTRSPGVTPTPPPPRRASIDVDLPLIDNFKRPIPPSATDRTMEVSRCWR